MYQRQVAGRIGVDAFTIHNWEKGKSRPLIVHYPAIIRFLGYDPDASSEGAVAAQLKARRRELGMTQRAVAKILHVDPATVTGWEHGGTVLRREDRKRLAEFLGIPFDELVPAMRRRWNHRHR